jgi:hypothetical protein
MNCLQQHAVQNRIFFSFGRLVRSDDHKRLYKRILQG